MDKVINMVKVRLEEDGMTMEALADSFEMSRGSLYNKLTGKNHFLFSEAIKLAKWLDISLDKLGDAYYEDI